MMLADTGAMLALLDQSDPHHEACVRVATQIHPDALITTWPCITETMYLLFRTNGYAYQRVFWDSVIAGYIRIIDLTSVEMQRMSELMAKYQDFPMDLADASLVAAAETRGFKQIFTLDSDFRAYRLANGSVLEVIP